MKLGRQSAKEKLYSTGSQELDNLLTKAFSEGYEYAQKEFAKKDEDGENHRGLGRAYLIGGIGGVIGRHAGKKSTAKAIKEGKKLDKAEEEGTKKAKKVGAVVNAGLGGLGAGISLAATKKMMKGAAKRNKRAAMIGSAIGSAAGIAAGTALGALGAEVGKDKNDKERRIKRVK